MNEQNSISQSDFQAQINRLDDRAKDVDRLVYVARKDILEAIHEASREQARKLEQIEKLAYVLVLIVFFAAAIDLFLRFYR